MSFGARHLSTRSRNLIDDVGEHNILIVVLHANLLPLNVLSQSNVVAEERMRHAAGIEK